MRTDHTTFTLHAPKSATALVWRDVRHEEAKKALDALTQTKQSELERTEKELEAVVARPLQYMEKIQTLYLVRNERLKSIDAMSELTAEDKEDLKAAVKAIVVAAIDKLGTG
jgi:hypothetical protein